MFRFFKISRGLIIDIYEIELNNKARLTLVKVKFD